jgi:hypothetical protein
MIVDIKLSACSFVKQFEVVIKQLQIKKKTNKVKLAVCSYNCTSTAPENTLCGTDTQITNSHEYLNQLILSITNLI